MQWIIVCEPVSKKLKTVPSRAARKVVATMFWNSHGIIMIDYLDKGKNKRQILRCDIPTSKRWNPEETSVFGQEENYVFITTTRRFAVARIMVQIDFPPTQSSIFFCSRTWKNDLVGRNFHRRRVYFSMFALSHFAEDMKGLEIR